jgi:hypothetical protein
MCQLLAAATPRSHTRVELGTGTPTKLQISYRLISFLHNTSRVNKQSKEFALTRKEDFVPHFLERKKIILIFCEYLSALGRKLVGVDAVLGSRVW